MGQIKRERRKSRWKENQEYNFFQKSFVYQRSRFYFTYQLILIYHEPLILFNQLMKTLKVNKFTTYRLLKYVCSCEKLILFLFIVFLLVFRQVESFVGRNRFKICLAGDLQNVWRVWDNSCCVVDRPIVENTKLMKPASLDQLSAPSSPVASSPAAAASDDSDDDCDARVIEYYASCQKM